MNSTESFIKDMSDAQRMQNHAFSKFLDEMPYKRAFDRFYRGHSFKWIPKWLQKKLEPMAYKCFREGSLVDIETEIQRQSDFDFFCGDSNQWN